LVSYLGWNFGAALPEARELLRAELAKNGGDLLAIEAMVLRSLAYGLAAEPAAEAAAEPAAALAADEGASEFRWAHGPTKFLTPEAWLRSAGVLIGADAGECDFRYPNLPETPSEIRSELEDRYPRNADGTIDPWFRDTAAAMGGCPGVYDAVNAREVRRAREAGVEQVVAADEAALTLCSEHAGAELGPKPGESNAAMVKRLFERALGRAAGEAEVEEVLAAAAEHCEGCDAAQLARDLCVGLIGGLEYAAY
jgi:hypothetical protein